MPIVKILSVAIFYVFTLATQTGFAAPVFEGVNDNAHFSADNIVAMSHSIGFPAPFGVTSPTAPEPPSNTHLHRSTTASPQTERPFISSCRASSVNCRNDAGNSISRLIIATFDFDRSTPLTLPPSLMLLGVGIIGLAAIGRRRGLTTQRPVYVAH